MTETLLLYSYCTVPHVPLLVQWIHQQNFIHQPKGYNWAASCASACQISGKHTVFIDALFAGFKSDDSQLFFFFFFFLYVMVFAATVRLKTFAGWRIESVNDCGAREVTVGDLLLWAQCAFESAYIAVKLQPKQEQRTERITAKTDCTNEI